jgi:dTDP-L-rhamnose 4-epimerase
MPRVAAGRAPEVFEDGGQARDFVHVTDVARANVLALSAPVEGPFITCNVASGTPHTVGDLARALAGPDAPVVTGRWRLGDVRHIVASPARAADLLGFVAQVSFACGMAELAHAGSPA